MGYIEDVLRQDLDTLGPKELLESCKAHRKFLKDARSEVDHLQTLPCNHRRVSSFPDSISSDTRLNWTRAEIDSPEDTSSSYCFGGKPKYSTIIAFKPGGYLRAQNRQALESELGISSST